MLIVLTPLTVAWDWPPAVSAALLFIVIFLLLITGQTIIFLLRLVAADRRGRAVGRWASATKTVGELEDAATAAEDPGAEAPRRPRRGCRRHPRRAQRRRRPATWHPTGPEDLPADEPAAAARPGMTFMGGT